MARIVTINRWFYLLPVLTASIISVFCLAELWETIVAEETERRLRRSHGLFGLAVVRLFHTIGELQYTASELDAISPLSSSESSISAKPLSYSIIKFVVSKKVTTIACVFALVSCVADIVQDLTPSGHHGGALVAASELLNQLFRLNPAKSAALSDKGATAEQANEMRAAAERYGKRLQIRRFVTMAVALPAAMCACREVVQDVLRPPGAHHAVALLAAAQFTENAYRALYSLGVQRPPTARLMVV